MRESNNRLVELQVQTKPSYAPGMPNTLIIETGAICPLKCPFCPPTREDFDLSREFLQFDKFKKIICLLETERSLKGTPTEEEEQERRRYEWEERRYLDAEHYQRMMQLKMMAVDPEIQKYMNSDSIQRQMETEYKRAMYKPEEK